MKTIYIRKRNILRAFGFSLVIIAVMLFSNYIINEAIETISENKGDRNLPIYSVETNEKVVAITFDAAWGNEDTEQLLSILDEYNVIATFFLCGKWVDTFPDDVKSIYNAGHDIANHSTTHPHMTQLSNEQCKEEVMTNHNNVKELINEDMNLFRVPYGDYDERIIDAIKECGYYTIQWDVDSLDWKEYGVEHEIKTVVEHKALQNGSIILFHNDTKYTPDALPAIFEGLIDKGYSFVPLSELIIQEDYYLDVTGRQFPTDEKDKTDI